MNIRKKYVYDLLTRISHAGIGGASLLLFLSAQLANYFYENGKTSHFIWMLHIYLGYLLVFFFTMRIIWFFKGPKYSRLSNLIKIKEWKEILLAKKFQRIKWNWGHHPSASIAYLLLYLVLLFLIFSGLFLSRIQFDMGPLPAKYYDEVELLTTFLQSHETASWLIIIFTIVHLAGLFWHQLKDKVPVFESMRTGYQYKRSESETLPGELEDECD